MMNVKEIYDDVENSLINKMNTMPLFDCEKQGDYWHSWERTGFESRLSMSLESNNEWEGVEDSIQSQKWENLFIVVECTAPRVDMFLNTHIDCFTSPSDMEERTQFILDRVECILGRHGRDS